MIDKNIEEQIIEEEKTMNSIALSKKPNSAMQEMMGRIDVLRDIYILETEALKKTDSKAFLSLQEQKLSAAQEYQSGIAQMLSRKDEMRNADPSLKQKLSIMQKDFSVLAQENSDALKRMKRCTERIGQTIRNVAKDAVKKQRSVAYNEIGHMQNVNKKCITTGINETA